MTNRFQAGFWSAFLFLGVVAACNGPSVPLRTPPMTVEVHDREKFPTAHGAAENPTHDCNVCHGGFDTFAQYNCVGCHAHEKTVTDKGHAKVDAYQYASANCYGCHPTGLAVNRATHKKYFPIDSSTPHNAPTCAQCHTTGDYRTFACIECHDHAQPLMDSAHAGIGSYVYASKNCYACHPTGQGFNAAQHESFFPIQFGAHSQFQCSDCHTDATNFSAFTCTGCHSGLHACSRLSDRHSDVGGFQCKDSACYSCHRNGVGDD